MSEEQKRVRAKFWVTDIKHLETGSPNEVCASIQLQPVYNNGDPGNASWSKYTPSGKLEMSVTNPSAIDAFEMGKPYYIDFTPAD